MTVTFLDLKDCSDTAIFVKAVNMLWNYINAKPKDASKWQNYKLFLTGDEKRLEAIYSWQKSIRF